jgi:Rrf2 family protein
VELTSKTEYAILALLELAAHYQAGEPLQIRQIAATQDIPDRYLEQLLASLRRCGLVKSQRGSKGGYILGAEPRKITLLDIVNCLEGTETKNQSERYNYSHLESGMIEEIWQEIQSSVNNVLAKYTLQDLCEKRNARKQLDIMYYI